MKQLLLTILFLSLLASNAKAQFAGGSGTEEEPYQIETVDQLQEIRNHTDKHFIQINDIDASDTENWNDGRGFEPIGNSLHELRFVGSFDGNNKVIKELYINRSSDFIGLFGFVNPAGVVHSVGIENANIVGNNYVGTLIGYNHSNMVYNCYSVGNVSGSDNVGGLIGYNSGEVNNNYSIGSISGFRYVGGLIGRQEVEGNISNSYSTASVSGSYFVGGLLGFNSSNSTISKSYSTGSVSDAWLGSGGLVGDQYGLVNNSFWNSETSSKTTGVGRGSDSGIISLSTAQMIKKSSFVGFDFGEGNPWAIYEGFSFPFLREVGNHLVSVVEIDGQEGWRMMASPFDGASYGEIFSDMWIQGFPGADAEGGSPNIFQWDESTRSFIPPSHAGDAPPPGAGFIAWIFEEDVFGEPGAFPKRIIREADQRRGQITLPVSLTLSANGGTEFDPANDGWNMVDNPYASPIDWDASSGWSRAGLSNTIYIWDHMDNNYRSWNGLVGSLGSGQIAPWQSFWVKADNSEAPSLTADEDTRASDAEFRREAADKTPVVELKLSGGDLRTSTFVMLNPEAKVGLNGFDAFQLDPLSADYLLLYTVIEDGHALDINALPTGLEEKLELPLVVDGSDLSGEFLLEWSPDNLPEGWVFELYDSKTDETALLSKAWEYRIELENKKSISERQKAEESTEAGLQAKHPDLVSEALKAGDTDESRFTILIIPERAVSSDPEPELPKAFDLAQNYPNPFNTITMISYDIPQESAVRLAVYDLLGQRIAVLFDETRAPGSYRVTWDGSQLSSGVYIYRLEAGGKSLTRHMTLVK